MARRAIAPRNFTGFPGNSKKFFNCKGFTGIPRESPTTPSETNCPESIPSVFLGFPLFFLGFPMCFLSFPLFFLGFPMFSEVFPNETSFWETPLRIKEIAGDRRADGVSGPNPAAESWWACFFQPWCVFPEKHTISRQHPGS